MNPNDQAVIHSSSESNWRTPDALFLALDREFHFTCDLAATCEDRKCPRYFGPDHEDVYLRDALTTSWMVESGPDGSALFLNPPFSRDEYRRTKNPAMLIDNWARKCWEESQKGCTIVAVMPFAPQTSWYRSYVWGQGSPERTFAVANLENNGKPTALSKPGMWLGHAAAQERRLPHRIGFLRPDGTPAGNAGVNSAIVVWTPMTGVVGTWTPHQFYWSYR